MFRKLSNWQWLIEALQNSNFHLEAQILLLSIIAVNCFLSSEGLLCLCSRKCRPNTQVWVTIVYLSVFLSSKSGNPLKKVASSACNSNNCTDAFLWDNHHTLVWNRRELVMCIFHYVTKTIKEMFTQELWCNRIFTVQSKTLLKDYISFPTESLVVKNTMTISTAWSHCLDLL